VDLDRVAADLENFGLDRVGLGVGVAMICPTRTPSVFDP